MAAKNITRLYNFCIVMRYPFSSPRRVYSPRYNQVHIVKTGISDSRPNMFIYICILQAMFINTTYSSFNRCSLLKRQLQLQSGSDPIQRISSLLPIFHKLYEVSSEKNHLNILKNWKKFFECFSLLVGQLAAKLIVINNSNFIL